MDCLFYRENPSELSVQVIEFSGELSRNIEEKSQELSIPVSELAKHPDKLEKIISDQFDITYFFLEKSKSSGIFFVLDATVNPTLYNSQNSKAGLYLKNMEPNIINSSHPNIIVLRGFPSLGRKNSLSLHTQWKMEFDVSNASYYHLPMEAARSNPQLPLSRLYYWTPVLSLPGTSEENTEGPVRRSYFIVIGASMYHDNTDYRYAFQQINGIIPFIFNIAIHFS